MAGIIGATGGKQRSTSGFNAGPLKSIDRNLVDVSGVKGLNDTLLSQISEALKTGGVGAQIPIIQNAVSGANQATSQALKGTTESLARSGLGATPFGQRQLAETRLAGAQAAGAIPTQFAQQYIQAAPQYGQGLLGTILGSLQKSVARSGPYST